MTEFVPAWVDGILTPVEKLEAHQRGLRHMAVSVFVLAGDQLLIQRRALGKYHTPGLWAKTCCTHPRWEEAPGDCATRRLTEELGISGLTLRDAGQVEYRAEVGNGLIEHEVVDIFVGQADTSLPLHLNPEEVCDTAWVRLDQLEAETRRNPDKYTPWLRIYLAEHQAAIFGVRAPAA